MKSKKVVEPLEKCPNCGENGILTHSRKQYKICFKCGKEFVWSINGSVTDVVDG